MICTKCRLAASVNRRVADGEYSLPQTSHPKNCGCPCMHKKAEKWEKMYSVEQPSGN